MANDQTEGKYEIGYGSPPVESRFRDGISGNPRGRPKKTLVTILMEAFSRRILVQLNGRSRKVSVFHTIMLRLKAKALKGSASAIAVFYMALDMAGLTAEVSEEERKRRGMAFPRSFEPDEMDLIQGEARELDRQRYLAMAENREAPRTDCPAVPAAIKTGDQLAAECKFAAALNSYRSELARCKTKLTANSADRDAQYGFRKALGRIGLVAYTHFLDREFEQVIAITDEAIEEGTSPFWVAPNDWERGWSNTRWLNVLRAHAQMFCNREGAARQFYLRIQTPAHARYYTSWECTIQHDFFQLRLTGHTHPLMWEIEKHFHVAGWIRDTNDPIPPRVEDHLPHATDIKMADRLVQQGALDEALAAYRHLLATDNQGELNLLADRIGRLARAFLLIGGHATALECADEAIRRDPYSTSAHLDRAHALMFLNGLDEARRIYLRYYDKNLPLAKMGQDAIKQDFAQLREAGSAHSLMTEVEKTFAGALWEQKLAKDEDSPPGEIPPTVRVEAASPPLDDLQSGQTLYSEGRLDEALKVTHRCIAKPSPDRKANEERLAAVILASDIARDFVAAGKFDNALAALSYSLSKFSGLPIANIRRAHALMFQGDRAEATMLYLQYRNTQVPPAPIGKDIILEDFGFLRSRGRVDPLMDDIELRLRSSEQAGPTGEDGQGKEVPSS